MTKILRKLDRDLMSAFHLQWKMSLLPQQVASRNQNVAMAMPTVSAVVSFPAPTEDVSLDIAQEGVQESARFVSDSFWINL